MVAKQGREFSSKLHSHNMRLEPTLNYLVNDCDIIFEAKCDDGQQYIALHTGDPDGGCEYTLVPATEKALIAFKEERIDMRELMLEKGEEEWYIVTTYDETGNTIAFRQEGRISETRRLPKKGYHPLRTEPER